MAGALAATVDTGNAYLMYDQEAKLKKKENAEAKADRERVEAERSKGQDLQNEQTRLSIELLKKKIEKLKNPNKGDSPSSSSIDTPQSTSVSPQSISTIQPTSYTGSLDTLSPEDKKYISFGVSAEARRGTPDELAVASVILKRMKNQGKSAKDIVFAPDQFEAVTGPNPKAYHDPVLQKRLFGKTGLTELEDMMNLIGDRTQFRGLSPQTRRGRSGNDDLNNDGKPDLDLMVHPRGNFYFNENQINQ
tara:strand:- start:748 stop:1491 length:744 start_codon:yes stop_codon:yes gene_type:complete